MNAVREFERAFANYVGADYAIALCNGTATLHTALAALGVEPGDKVAVPPLTMASTTIAVLHAGAEPRFVDVEPDTWLMRTAPGRKGVPVSLYGLHYPHDPVVWIDDAAQTLRPHGGAVFTSYSFQASKILPLGEGGMLVTDVEDLAVRAREFSSLGYKMGAESPAIDPEAIKAPWAARHHSLGWNYRMSEYVAQAGIERLKTMWEPGTSSRRLNPFVERRACKDYYAEAIKGTDWVTPQHVPDGWKHDYWCYAVALESADLWQPFVSSIERNGGERPYGAWRITYQEPAFRHLAEDGMCPVAEDLQPRLVQFQTNDLESAKWNAEAVRQAIREVGGVPA